MQDVFRVAPFHPASTKNARVNGDPNTFFSEAKYYWWVDAREYNKEDDDMDINKMLNEMTDEQAYQLLAKAQRHAEKLPAPSWAQAELQEAVGRGITDGETPMQLVPRYQAAIMAKRAGRP